MPAGRFTDGSLEEPALRRLTLLLQRLKDDTGDTDTGVDALLVSLQAIRDSDETRGTVENLEATIDRMRTTPASNLDATSRLLRDNVVQDATDLANRLKPHSGRLAIRRAKSASLLGRLTSRLLSRDRGPLPESRSR
ncbi:MAG TPA: hypothetical protein VF701_06645 [Thermoanaerobaculia bacterium]